MQNVTVTFIIVASTGKCVISSKEKGTKKTSEHLDRFEKGQKRSRKIFVVFSQEGNADKPTEQMFHDLRLYSIDVIC